MNRRHVIQSVLAEPPPPHSRITSSTHSRRRQPVTGRTPEDVASDEDYWRKSATLLVDRNVVNLNNGYVALARTVQDALRRQLEYSDTGPYHTMINVLERQVETCGGASHRLPAATPKRSPSPAIPANLWRTPNTGST